jgi:hypothetical protein
MAGMGIAAVTHKIPNDKDRLIARLVVTLFQH